MMTRSQTLTVTRRLDGGQRARIGGCWGFPSGQVMTLKLSVNSASIAFKFKKRHAKKVMNAAPN